MAWKATSYVKSLVQAPNGEPLTTSEKCVLMILADYYNESRGAAFPSVATLAKCAILSARRVREIISVLKRKGVLHVEHIRRPDGSNKTNNYSFPGLDEHEIDHRSPSCCDTQGAP